MHNYDYLSDSAFLKKVDLMRVKEQYVKITLLHFITEDPIQEIQGRISAGNINVNGDSAIRRTGSLTFVADLAENDITNMDNLITANKKVEIEIGFKNTTKEYTNYSILWFPLGIFVITDVSITHSLADASITLNIKDKMCLLNGECGGIIPASATFGELVTEYEDGTSVVEEVPMFDIIRTVVSQFGGEQLGRIIINDLPLRGKQVLRWNGSSPLYIYYKYDNSGKKAYYFSSNENDVKKNTDMYQVYEPGMNVGYKYTDLTFPGELTANAGDSVVTILDKIKGALGNYEYFYDIHGNFVFQEIKNYLNTAKSTVDLNNFNNENYEIDYGGSSVYSFDDATLITSYTNTPNFLGIKNDFVQWGIKEDSSGISSVIRYHVAIDEKPKCNQDGYKCFFYTTNNWCDNTTVFAGMAIDSGNTMPDNPINGYFYKVNGIIYKYDKDTFTPTDYKETVIVPTDWRTELYFRGLQASVLGLDTGYYWAELKNEWPRIYDIQNGKFKDIYINNPTEIPFYLDFIDTQSEVGNLSVSNIGRRTSAKSSNDINCVFAPEFPDLIIIDASSATRKEEQQECERNGQDYIQLQSNFYDKLITSSGHNAAFDAIRDELYTATSFNESISVVAVPIYHLEPNTRITVKDEVSGIKGDYIINSISLPLDINGTMSLSCKRALQRY